MVDHNQRGVGRLAQAQQALAQSGHGAGVVFILVMGGIQRVQDNDLRGGRLAGNGAPRTDRAGYGIPGSVAATAAAPRVRPISSRAIKNSAITVMAKRRYARRIQVATKRCAYSNLIGTAARGSCGQTPRPPTCGCRSRAPSEGGGLRTAAMVQPITIRVGNLFEILLDRANEGCRICTDLLFGTRQTPRLDLGRVLTVETGESPPVVRSTSYSLPGTRSVPNRPSKERVSTMNRPLRMAKERAYIRA